MPLDVSVPRRSDGTLQFKRLQQPWPENRSFRILSIDGGGILGLLPCLILSELERRFLGGQSAGQLFDMITGTSTGGIIAMGLGQGKTASEISKLYIERGRFIFPGSSIVRTLRRGMQVVLSPYNPENLERELRREFADSRLGSSKIALCIPSFEGRYGEPYIFKTPHHPDYKNDQHETLVDVGMATAAAPTWFSAVKRGGYVFADGGIWANNPVMVGLTDALSCFDIQPRQVRVLSLGCGQEIHRMRWWHRVGGKLFWAGHFVQSAMRAQSHNALGQAGLLVGKDHLVRLDAPEVSSRVSMDDVPSAIDEMPPIARALVEGSGHRIANFFASTEVGPTEVN